MIVENRIKAITALNSLSIRAFALRCGINPQTLDRQLKGERAISITTIGAILATFPEISAEWLLRGEGEMLRAQGGAAGVDMSRRQSPGDTTYAGPGATISAGMGQGCADEGAVVSALREVISEKDARISLLERLAGLADGQQ